MPDKPNNPFPFWQELKRRKVIRVIPVYAAASFVLLELVDIIAEPLRLPDWTINFVLVLLGIGFIISIILSWVYDITPEGVQKTKPATQVRSEEKQATPVRWKISTYISVLIIIAFVVFYIVSSIKKSSDISKLEKSIAVLPFENWNSDEEYAHMGDAIANEINTQLAKVEEFHVFSYTSSSQYKGSDKPSTPQIGKELGANFIIEGTIERQKENVSIHVQVIQTEDDDHIWAHEFKGKWEDIFTIRAEIAIKIAEKLKTVLSTEEIEQIEKKPTENLEAYDLYLLGRYYWNKRTEEGLKKSIEYFEQAKEINSNYALAYAGLADAYMILAWWNYLPKETYLKAKEIALEALEIDKNLAEAHASLGFIASNFEWKRQDAEKEFKRAIELNPNYPQAHAWYATFLACIGQFEEAFVQIKKALELDPLSLITNYISGLIYNFARQYDEAIIKHQKALEIDKNFMPSHTYIFWSYLLQGMDIEAIEKLQEIMSMDTLTVKYVKVVGDIYEKSGIEGVLHLLIDLKFTGMGGETHYFLAKYYAMLGEKEQALGLLDRNYEIRGYLHTLVDPAFDNIRTDPRFIELLKKMGLEE